MALKANDVAQTFDSKYYKSSLYLLYGGMRKTLFVNPYPINGISSKNIGLKVGKAFYDLNKQQLECKEEGCRVKAGFGGSQLFNMKMKVGDKVKGHPTKQTKDKHKQLHIPNVLQ